MQKLLGALCAGLLAGLLGVIILASATPTPAEAGATCNVEASTAWTAAKASVSGVGDDSQDAWAGGLGGGCDIGLDAATGLDFTGWQAGVLTRYDWSSLDGVDGQWSLAARLGTHIQPDMLVYGLAGATFADLGGWRTGLLLGLGVERDLSMMPGWALRGEYDYNRFDVGNATLEEHMIRLGVVYRFGDPAPAVAALAAPVLPAAPAPQPPVVQYKPLK